jgi:hypothetical protein
MTFDERVCALKAATANEFTDRQSRFLVTVMLHSGVCMVRQYCAFGKIVYGQAARAFFGRLVSLKVATTYETVDTGARVYHIQHRPFYTAIGEPHSRFRRPASIGRAIERLMILDHVLGHPDTVWLSTEGEKVTHFTTVLGTSFERRELPQLTFGEGERRTIRYFPYKLPIAVADEGRSHLFAYLVVRSAPVDFRSFLRQHAELFRALPRWTLRLLIPQHFANVADAYIAALQQELASPLRPAILDELSWYFERERDRIAGRKLDPADATRYHQACRAFQRPRFRGLYRAWLEGGKQVFHAAASPVIASAFERGTARVERYVLPHSYLHLWSMVGTA